MHTVHIVYKRLNEFLFKMPFRSTLKHITKPSRVVKSKRRLFSTSKVDTCLESNAHKSIARETERDHLLQTAFKCPLAHINTKQTPREHSARCGVPLKKNTHNALLCSACVGKEYIAGSSDVCSFNGIR